MSLTTDQTAAVNTREGIIIAALRSGNLRRAVELLLETYQDELYAYCARLAGPAQAVRIYHRVLGAAIDDLSARDATTSLRAWLFGIARRTITHQHRVGRPAEQTLDPDYVPVETDETAGAGSYAASGSHVEQGMSELDCRAREVLQLTLWHGLTLAEVAKITERSEAEVRAIAGEGLAYLSMSCSRRAGRPS